MPDKATQATITIDVAADKPPMNTITDNQPSPPDSGSWSTNRSGFAPSPSNSNPAAASGTTNRLMRTR